MAKNFEISPVVEKELRRQNLKLDEILRAALKIKPEGFTTSDGKHFPEGTVFIAWYKEKALAATVKNGALEVEGKQYSSLSAAAAHYTGRATTNGWDFWYVRKPGDTEFVQAKKLAA